MRLDSGLIEHFVNLISACWEDVDVISRGDQSGSFTSDWLQATWELAVESLIKDRLGQSVYLEPYGDGADSNGASSRILDPEAVPTHSINCVPKDTAMTCVDQLNGVATVFPRNGFQCDRFVTIGEDGWYYERPPFDMVLVASEGTERVFAVGEILFLLKTLQTQS